MNPQPVFRLVSALAVVCLISAAASRQPVLALNPNSHIEELMAGANGDASIQFIVIRQKAAGQNTWGPQGGETQSRAMLVFFDASGRETGKYKFPSDPPAGAGLHILVATQAFADLPGSPTPDVTIPPLLVPFSGQVCFRNNPANPAAPFRSECVSYGNFSGDTGTNVAGDGAGVAAGAPAAPLPILNTISLKRRLDRQKNADFTSNVAPEPAGSAGIMFPIPLADRVTQGRNLFTKETFAGNGRTCATCHDGPTLNLTPAKLQERFANVSTTFDPLFIAETRPSSFDDGFDFNLNVLVLTAEVASGAPCTGELRGIITTAGGGRAKVLARTSPTRYLVYGGINPALSGTVSDDASCSATVASIMAGSLGAVSGSATPGLEDPARMRGAVPGFPQGRALILENIDGFSNPAVFRKSPQLLNLSHTAPFGFNGNSSDLREFTTVAVRQHFPRSLVRATTGDDADFRLPTDAELFAIEAFLLAQEFPASDDPNKFDLDRFATTRRQELGRVEFVLGIPGFPLDTCANCHGGPTLSHTTKPVLGKPVGVNASFDTGTARIGAPLPCEPGVGTCNSREFNVPSLFNLKHTTPLFHNGSAATVANAVNFYTGAEFTTSPAGLAVPLGGRGTSENTMAFLEGLTERPYTLSGGPLHFGAQDVNAGATGSRAITITNRSDSAISFANPACVLTNNTQGEFRITSCPLASPLAAGGSRTITVTFDPATTGLRRAILEVSAETPSGVVLYGIGGSLRAEPTLTSVSPSSGTVRGGDLVTLTGTNFDLQQFRRALGRGLSVSIGGVDAGFLVGVSDTTITARTPRGVAGPADVVLTNLDGQSAILTGGFTFTVEDPTVSVVSPAVGSPSGGSTIAIIGTRFAPGAAVTIGGTSASRVTVLDSRTIIATTPATDAPGAADVVVTNRDGGRGQLPSGFRYHAPFTDEAILVRLTVIQAAHVTELRERITGRRRALQLDDFAWTDANLSAASRTPIRTRHIEELRTALDGIYTALGRTPPTYTDPSLTAGLTEMKYEHIAELRNALVVVE